MEEIVVSLNSLKDVCVGNIENRLEIGIESYTTEMYMCQYKISVTYESHSQW